MGVPKFFRYMSERYPCLSEFVREYQIPAFDNLYLDMNGIIHMCSHPDDNNPHFRITEEKLFADIFHYIEFLFRMIKPQKVFFMAIDGVAPRAKMNQQRGRRFRSAKDAEKSESEAKKKGEKLPDVARFDSNCITPGTEFMAKLHEQLKYFVVNKISTDRTWRKCKVILSGHETPGEGEHKIMDYIRYIRSKPGYDPNTRHCLYGLDADLIMLGLCTHDPHFSLLREEVKFGKKSTKRNNVPEEIRFYLLHLSLMREYLELEFAPLKDKLNGFEYDLEKIIDDWVLMGFLVGNDFIPNLPNLHIANGALPVLYKAYMDILPTLDGYINEGGTLNLKRFEKFMEKLGNLDLEKFEETNDSLMYMESKTGRKQTAHAPVSTRPDRDYEDAEPKHKVADADLAALISEMDNLAKEMSDEYDTTDDDEDAAFKSYKNEYYRNKLEYRKVTKEVMRDQAEGYVRAIQWNLNYYYNGVCSWSWYYPHHYSPYISDIKGFSDLKIEFDLGTPFKPYEQLLAVLPAASKELLPKAYHHLMVDNSSIIKDYYPEDFQTDLNGKRQEWEAVVLVPFIDENILLEAMLPCNAKLTPEEVKRNTHGPMLVYTYSDDDLGPYESPAYFPVVNHSRAKRVDLYVEDLRVPKEKLVKGAYPGAKFDVFYPGFPTMKHLNYKGEFKKGRVKIFEQPSRNENLILTIIPKELYFEDSIPVDLLGKTVFVGWPNLVEAKIEALSNVKMKYTVSKSNEKPKIEQNNEFQSALEGISQLYMSTMGINFGETKVLVHSKQMISRRYVFTSNGRMTLERQYSTIVTDYPLQAVVMDITVHDDCHSAFREVTDVFPVGSTCYTLANPHYGSLGTIMDSKESLKNDQLKVSLSVVDEPDFSHVEEMDAKSIGNYINLHNSAGQLTISNYVFSRVTGSIFISTPNGEGGFKSVNVGLDLKFNKKNQETPGYTKKINNVWHYTRKAIDLMRIYIERYPEIFQFLTDHNKVDDLNADEVFGDDSDEKVKSLQTWLRSLPTHNIERRVCNSSVIEPELVAEIEKAVENYNPSPRVIVLQLKPHFLYKPEIQVGNGPPDRFVKTRVFDRIVNVREGITVPVGIKGTVIAVHKSSDILKENDEMYDIVFDTPFAGGIPLNCSDKRGYRLPKTCFINITHGKRIMEEKTGKPGMLLAAAKANQNTNNFRPSHFNARAQNSAFASFTTNNQQSNALNQYQFNGKLVKSSDQFGGQPFFQQQHQPAHAAYIPPLMGAGYKPNKPPSDYRGDYVPNPFQRGGPKDNHNFRQRDPQQNRPITREPPPNEGPAKVNTDFLKKLLKIEDPTISASAVAVKQRNADRQATKAQVDVSVVPFGSVPRSRIANTSAPQQRQVAGSSHHSTKGIVTASAKLLNYFQTHSLGCPRYEYFESRPGMYCARILLPHIKMTVIGTEKKTREEASEAVASEAMKKLEIYAPAGVPNTIQTVPPSAFPEPPQKWVQHNQPQTNHHQNKNSQSTQVLVKKNIQQNQNLSQSSTKTPNTSSSNNNLKTSPSSTSSFVPLQAIMKRQCNKNINIAGKHSNMSVRTEKGALPQVIPTQEQNPSSSTKQTEKKPKRQRKTRIAANFVAKAN